MKRMLDKITECLSNGRPFVAYHKPGDDWVEAFFQVDSSLHLDPALEGSGFVFAPFDTGKTVLFGLDNSERVWTQYKDMVVPENEGKDSIFPDERDGEAKNRHLELVDKAIDQIKIGKASKLVVSRKETIRMHGSVIAGFQRILSIYPKAFTYLWHHPEIGTWMGATPEVLLKVNGNTFQTIALAGTMEDDGSDQQNWGEKEKEEQQMVTEHIQKELAHIPIKVGPTKTVKAGNLFHLRTDLEGELPSSQLLSEVVKRLHPTAAVCGLPRDEAKNFLLQNEGYDRTYYTGFLGELRLPGKSPGKSENSSQTQLFVNLRCARIASDKDHAMLFVGGGITSSSEPEKEWDETVAKSMTMKKVLRNL